MSFCFGTCSRQIQDSDNSETFSIQGKGTLLDVVRGVNVPKIVKKISTYLALEEKIKAGEAERVEVSVNKFHNNDC